MFNLTILFLMVVFSYKVMIIVAWNGSGNPSSIFEVDVFKKVLSVFITAAILKLGQGNHRQYILWSLSLKCFLNHHRTGASYLSGI